MQPSESAGDSLAQRSIWILLISVVVTLVMHLAPHGRVIARPLIYLFTLAHEMGHGVTAMLVGSDFTQFQMFSDGSGFAAHTGGSALAMAAIAAGGLVGPAVVAGFGFAFARHKKIARLYLALVGLFCLWALIFKVRNGFGGVVVAAVVALSILFVLFRQGQWARLVVIFISVQLSLSVFERADYLFTESGMVGGRLVPSDVSQMADALLLPYWFWGALCAAISVIVLILGVWTLVRQTKITASAGRPSILEK